MKEWPIAELIPHTGEMILLDRVDNVGEDGIVCIREVRRDEMFVADDGHFPAWAGIELMAQSVAAWAGYVAHQERRPVRLGFLLGSRHYTCNVDTFPLGTTLRIHAERAFLDENGMAVFACRIDAPGIHAEARLTVFSPPHDNAAFSPLAMTETNHV